MSSDDAGGAGSISLGLVPVETNKASAFPFEFAEKFSDDPVLSKRGAGGGGAGFASLGLIPVEINTASALALEFPLHLLCWLGKHSHG
jgi:hypothetical protein